MLQHERIMLWSGIFWKMWTKFAIEVPSYQFFSSSANIDWRNHNCFQFYFSYYLFLFNKLMIFITVILYTTISFHFLIKCFFFSKRTEFKKCSIEFVQKYNSFRLLILHWLSPFSNFHIFFLFKFLFQIIPSSWTHPLFYYFYFFFLLFS